MGQTRSDLLLAVLLNPPGSTSGVRTINAVARAAQALAFNGFQIANLCATPTPTVVELNQLDTAAGWMDARASLTTLIDRADGVLAGWGVSGATGLFRAMRNEQVQWLCGQVAVAGLSHIWTVGGEPRHPSRWHQYVSDKYGRTAGGSFEERLTHVLHPIPVTQFAAATRML